MPPPLTLAIGGAIGVGLALVARHLLDPEASLEPWRQCFLATGRRLLEAETPYQWGGGRNPGDWGVDCSGLFVVAMRECGVPLPPQGTTANVYYHSLPAVTEPKPGDLAFFGHDGKAVHVVMVEKYLGNGDAVTIGANGGDSDVTSPEVARSRGAKVTRKLVSEFSFNPFLGYATLDPEMRNTGGMQEGVGKPIWCCGLWARTTA